MNVEIKITMQQNKAIKCIKNQTKTQNTTYELAIQRSNNQQNNLIYKKDTIFKNGKAKTYLCNWQEQA